MHDHRGVAVAVEPSADRPLKELVTGLGRDMSLLIRQEMELAKAELSEKASRTARGATKIGIGALLAYVGVLAVAAALVLVVIEIGVTAWLAAAVVGAVFLAAGYANLQSGRRSLAQGQPTLRRTKANVKETVQQLKEQLQ